MKRIWRLVKPTKNYFLTSLRVVVLDDNSYMLTSPLIYHSNKFGKIYVPEGFRTNFTSIPRLGLIYTFLANRGNYSSTLHDYLYCKQKMTRKNTDLLFLQALKTEKISWYYRYPMYWGVRLFGGIYWGHLSAQNC